MGGLGEHVTCALSHVSLAGDDFLFTWFLEPGPARTGGPILTTNTSCDVFPRMEVLFGHRVDTAPHLGVRLKYQKTNGA